MKQPQDIVSRIALAFPSDEEFDSQLDNAFALIGEGLGISRCYLFVDSPDGSETSNTHEWCAPGIEHQKDKLQFIPYATIPGWKEMVESAEASPVDDISTLSAGVRAVLEPQGIKSLIIAQLLVDEGIRGFIGFDECSRVRSWTDAEKETILAAVKIIRTAWKRKHLAEQLASSEENFRRFFNTVGDIIIIGDLAGNVVYANEGACSKLGYTLDDIRALHILQLHPADRREEAGEILQSMFRGERTSCPLQLAAKDGSVIPVETRIWFGEWDGKPSIFGVSKDLTAEQAALQKFERLFRNNPAAMAISRNNTREFIDVNNAFLKTFGFDRDEVIGVSSVDLDLFVDDEAWQSAKNDLLASGHIRDRELVLRKRDGSLIQGLFSGDIIDSQGEEFFLTVMIDITAQVKLRNALDAERERLENVIDGTRLGTWEWNVQTGETVFNERWAQIVGYSLDELAPVSIKTWAALSHPDDLEESDRLLEEHFAGKTDYYEYEARMKHKDGRWIWVHDRGKVIERDSEGRAVRMYGTHADITVKKDLEEKIRELAIRDPLTGIYNRRYLFERLEGIRAECSRKGRSFCVSIFDIDHFKAINDTYGHIAGDVVLKEFAGLVASMVRTYDLVGRFGGEEFIVVSPDSSGQDIAGMTERILDKVRRTVFAHEKQKMRFTFSGGIACSNEVSGDPPSVEELLALADKRLYEAKAEGRDRCKWT